MRRLINPFLSFVEFCSSALAVVKPILKLACSSLHAGMEKTDPNNILDSSARQRFTEGKSECGPVNGSVHSYPEWSQHVIPKVSVSSTFPSLSFVSFTDHFYRLLRENTRPSFPLSSQKHQI